nr:AAA family ATPase [Parafrankia sp. EUN1f]
MPAVFPALTASGLTLRLGQMVLVASAPNVGKSPFALNLVFASRLRTLYFSADTDAYTQYCRLVALHSGLALEDIAREPHGYRQYLGADAIQWHYDANPSTEDIDDELLAYAQIWGAWPEIIVVDNLSNIYTGEAERWSALEKGLDYLHDLARKTGALIIVLHHVTGEFETGTDPVPLSGLRGKVSKVPEQVLTLWRAGDELFPKMGVAIVKNRGGKADPSGRYQAFLSWDLRTGRLT